MGYGKEYMDYPSCALDGTSDDWYCQMFLPPRDKQSDGNARFEEPGVLTGYFIASYIPDQEQLSFQKTTQLIRSVDWATSMTMSVTLAAAFVTLTVF